MISIASCFIYIPRYRLSRETIAQAWGSTPLQGSKAVSNFDEDSLTMGLAAVKGLGASAPGRLYFGSTSAPYWQRSTAAQISAACDWGPGTATVDLGGSLRGGFSGMLAAADAIAAGSVKEAIVAAADRREGAPESPEELTFGDAAAAVCLSGQPGIAELICSASRSDDFLDEWRRDSDVEVRAYTSKYSTTRGFELNVPAVVNDVLSEAGVDRRDVAWLALNSVDGRSHAACVKALGIDLGHVRVGLPEEYGVTGAAMPLIALVQAIEAAQVGELIVAVAYGDGATALLLRKTSEWDGLAAGLVKPIPYQSYARFRKSREYMRGDDSGPEISNVLWKSEERQNVRLHGTKCPVCGRIGFPISRVCGACRNAKELAEVSLSRTGRLFTFTKDYLYDAPVLPTVMAVVDLDGGGRFLCQMTDAAEADVRIGMPVELVLRRLREGGRNHHYYWKCRPVSEGAAS